MLTDVRFALRQLIKSPGFSIVAIATLALGIGANTAVFSVINGVLLRPLPFNDAHELVNLTHVDPRQPQESYPLSYPDFVDWQALNQACQHMAVYTLNDFTLKAENDEAALLQGAIVSADLFRVLRVSPILGRDFVAADDEPGARVVILSYAIWQRDFGGDPHVIGQTIPLSGINYLVIGVMPAGFSFPVQNSAVQLWTSLARFRESLDGGPPFAAARDNHFLSAIGRLRANVSVEQAQANLTLVANALAQQYPDTNAHVSARVTPLLKILTQPVRPALLILLGAAACVLLIGCANVANLLLARAIVRQREISIRAALGASRRRIIGQLLTESVLLALIGGALGILLAMWGTTGIAALLPSNFPRAAEIGLDAHALGFSAAISLVTGILFGLAPAWRVSHADISAALTESGSRGSTESGRNKQLRSMLVIAEVALALVLLTSAGLLMQSFWRLQRASLGFDPTNALTGNTLLSRYSYPEPQDSVRFYETLLERLRALPEVRSVTAGTPLPLSEGDWEPAVIIEGRPPTKSAERPDTKLRIVAPGYFRSMGITLRAGREFDQRDRIDSNPVVIVNETLARKFFPNENALGKHIAPQSNIGPGEAPMREIVGVVADVKFGGPETEPFPESYVPHSQYGVRWLTLVVRTESPNSFALASSVRQVLSEIDKGVPFYNVQTLEQYRTACLARPRLASVLLGIFASIALLLTAIGLYGVIAYSVAQRRQEIGIRLALGAQKADVLKLVIGSGIKLAVAGVLAGFVAALGLTRLLANLLYGIQPIDAPTLSAVAILLAAISLLASWIPARRASQLDPIVTLRSE